MLGCDGWAIPASDPPMRWDDHPAHKPTPINTSFPLLFISNTADPVTPLSAGLKMARKFTDAGFFEVATEGHCSLAAASYCASEKIRAYFQEGKVPQLGKEDGPAGKKWEVCEADEEPFRAYDQVAAHEVSEKATRMMMWKKLQDVTRHMKWMGRESEFFSPEAEEERRQLLGL